METKKSIEEIEKLEPYLSECSKEELAKIFAYGEGMKKRGEEKEKKFRSKHDREYFLRLLDYNRKHQGIFLGNYEYLDKLSSVEKEKFIEKYLYEDILYSYNGDLYNYSKYGNSYYYKAFKEGEIVMKEGVYLNFTGNKMGVKGVENIAENIELKKGVALCLNGTEIGVEGVKVLSEKMELKEGVVLDLSFNKFGDECAKVIAENMKLKVGVRLNLNSNQIGDEGVQAIAENMGLKEGVYLDLGFNRIGDEGAKAISKMELKEGVKMDLSYNRIGDEGAEALLKMELKEGVILNLKCNEISRKMKEKLKELENLYHEKGINCEVLVDY